MKRTFKKIVVTAMIGFLLLLLTINAAAATLTVHYNCEDDMTDLEGNYDATPTGVTYVADVPSYNTSGSGGTKSCYLDGNDQFTQAGGIAYFGS